MTENTLTVQGMEGFRTTADTDESTYAEMVNKYALENLLRLVNCDKVSLVGLTQYGYNVKCGNTKLLKQV